LRDLARRHGVRPVKALGQHFLVEPTLARRIVELAGVGPGDRVVEIGAGLGSLTVALAGAGAEVVAVELDRTLAPALAEAVGAFGPRVRVVVADALRIDWGRELEGGPWKLVANLPYNVAVPVVMRVLAEEPRIEHLLVMVQREVGERLAAAPGDEQFGAVSLRVAYRARAKVVRRVARTVFWPQPNVDSVLVSMQRRPPPVEVDRAALFETIEVAFAQRRKSMRGALMRLGLDGERAVAVLAACGIDPMERPERLGLEAFACLTEGRLAT
jgi:16S rRNA (adenine1518-N6/adenine1519-N6)-dimethyltransferase